MFSSVVASLNVLAPLARAQDYVVNGHAVSKAEVQLLASCSAPGWPLADG